MITIKTQIAFLLFAICYGCKVNKEKSERLHTDSRSQGSLETRASWTQFNSHDSSYRYWYYTGDSSFYFHPDIGLWSHSGQLAYIEQRDVKEQALATTYHYDSLGIESNRTASQTQVKTSSNPLKSWLWLLLVTPVLAVYWLWRRR